jgi:hypothetical protein
MTEDQEGDDQLQGSESTGDQELDRQVAGLKKEGERVQSTIDETRSDWEAKKDDPSVPGAAADPDAEELDVEVDADEFGGDDGDDEDSDRD